MDNNLFLTLMIAFVVIVIAIACLAIGWLITGKSRIEKACGRDPKKKVDESCGDVLYCDLCAPETKQRSTSEELEKEKRSAEAEIEKEEGDKRYS